MVALVSECSAIGIRELRDALKLLGTLGHEGGGAEHLAFTSETELVAEGVGTRNHLLAREAGEGVEDVVGGDTGRQATAHAVADAAEVGSLILDVRTAIVAEAAARPAHGGVDGYLCGVGDAVPHRTPLASTYRSSWVSNGS